MSKTIHILTGPVKSGKTTRLIAWIRYHEHCAGILAPVIEEKKHIYSIHNEQQILLEAEKGVTGKEQEKIEIGRYSFLLSAFQWARKELLSALDLNPRWFIIDEIGPLELAGLGLEPAVSTILNKFKRTKDHQLILVVREPILKQVISHYRLEDNYLLDESFLDIT